MKPIPHMSSDWKADCANIMMHLKKSIQNDVANAEPVTNKYPFVYSKEDFFLLNLDCENELKETKRHFTEMGIQLKYDMLYNTKYPYKITYTPEIKTTRVWQDQGEIFINTICNAGGLQDYSTLEDKIHQCKRI